MNMKYKLIPAITAILLCTTSSVVFAQGSDDATAVLARRLRSGDRVWVETNGSAVRTGRVVDVAPGILRLTTDGWEESIPVERIWRVQRKRNGVLLGTLVGAGVGFFALGLPVAAIGANEGTATVGPLLFATAVGAGTGAGLDALLSVKQTIYNRQQAAVSVHPVVAPKRAAILISKSF